MYVPFSICRTVRVVRTELLRQRGEPILERGVADLHLREIANLAFDLELLLGRRHLLNAEKILLVDHLAAIELVLERIEQFRNVDALVSVAICRLGSHLCKGYQTC